MNLIPVCRPGVSLGSEILVKAVSQFRKQLLAVIIACPEKEFEYGGEEPTPDNITRAEISAAICLFRELGTIGKISGFIHEDGMNINLSGTGGRHGKEFMTCLSTYGIQPWFYPVDSVYKQMAEWSGDVNNFSIHDLPLYKRLEYWERFIVDEIYPQLYTDSLGLFIGSRTGTWQETWDSKDIIWDYADESQLSAILDNEDFYGTFLNEISNLKGLNRLVLPDAHHNQILKKQIYIGVITCLETYLSDAFINTILSSDEYLRAFYSSFKDFKSQKFSMNHLFDKIDSSKENAKKAMLDVIYHNLPKVSGMYQDSLGVQFPDYGEVWKNIISRHDLVHRNGKTKDGKYVEINQVIVERVITRVERLVEEIDKQLKNLT